MVKIAKDQGLLTVAVTVTISWNKLKTVDLQTKVTLPPNMSARIWLFLSFERNQSLYTT